jgi:hypothetical protein
MGTKIVTRAIFGSSATGAKKIACVTKKWAGKLSHEQFFVRGDEGAGKLIV